MVTIKDVAKLANVSVATVSRVINNATNVQPETKEHVMQAIKTLNYSPNLLGRNLRRQETKKILVLLNTMSNAFYSRIVRGIEETALPSGYTVMVCMTHGDPVIEERYVQMLKTRLVDGAIFLTAEQQGDVLTDELKDNCVVQACEPLDDFITPTVSIDNQQAGFTSINYLIEKGHRRIAFFGAGDIYKSSRMREDGYRQALIQHNIIVEDSLILNEGFSFNAGIRSANELINRHKGNMPTAVFCISDSCAAGAMKTFTQNGINTPNDISIMGFDNTQLSQIFIPSITTLEQPQFDIGRKAMELLLDRINGKDNRNTRVILDYKIIERESVKSI